MFTQLNLIINLKILIAFRLYMSSYSNFNCFQSIESQFSKYILRISIFFCSKFHFVICTKFFQKIYQPHQWTNNGHINMWYGKCNEIEEWNEIVDDKPVNLRNYFCLYSICAERIVHSILPFYEHNEIDVGTLFKVVI